MSGHNHTHGRQLLIQFQPTFIKDFDELTTVHPRHDGGWAMSQRGLALGVLQEQVAFSVGHERSASQ